jgi:hypothetical protein
VFDFRNNGSVNRHEYLNEAHIVAQWYRQVRQCCGNACSLSSRC